MLETTTLENFGSYMLKVKSFVLEGKEKLVKILYTTKKCKEVY